MKINIVQFNPTVGDLTANLARMIELYSYAEKHGADLVVFPEMAITGYPIEDLAQSRHFIEAAQESANALLEHVQQNGKAGIIFGALIDNGVASKPSNGAYFLDPTNLAEMRIIKKYELPNYGVFDEKRVFEPAVLAELKPVTFRGDSIGVMICEDAWFPEVTNQLVGWGAKMLISINGSPYEIGKNKTRVDVVRKRLAEVFRSHTINIPFIYVNMVGGQDELVFDGGSFVIDQEGYHALPTFSEVSYPFEVDAGHTNGWKDFGVIEPTGVSETYNACVMGLRDYMAKQQFSTVVLGMSGGVDSGIVAAIAVDALGKDCVHLVRLPSAFSSEGSLSDAETASDRLGTKMRTIPIEPVVEALRAAYSGAGYDWIVEKQDRPNLVGVADENIQARARGTILMAVSNNEGHMLLTTGNKSEVSVGYSTLYGDMAGGFNPIKDCYKTTVWDMCRYRNQISVHEIASRGYLGQEGEIIPEAIISKPPSAELRADQKDEDSLPPYEVLDSILKKMVEQDMSVAQITADGFDLPLVVKVRSLLDRAEYKRRQAAPGVKVTSKLHGRERRVPIVNHFTGERKD